MYKSAILCILYIILAPTVGGLLAGMDRKISARMQGRIGPSILQPFYDVRKLFEKEPVAVNRAQEIYIGCFFVFMVITGAFFFAGSDLLLAVFSLTLASVYLVLAAYSSNSPYSQIGAERELLQMMAYEPMVLITVIGFYLTTGTFDGSEVLASPVGCPIVYMPLIFLGFLYILTIKFRKSPFDLSMSHHAHQELVRGLSTEFSGPTLGLVEIAHWYENVFLLGIVFLFIDNGTWITRILGVLVCLATYFLEVLIDNTCARMKWQFALKSAWLVAMVMGCVNLLALYYI